MDYPHLQLHMDFPSTLLSSSLFPTRIQYLSYSSRNCTSFRTCPFIVTTIRRCDTLYGAVARSFYCFIVPSQLPSQSRRSCLFGLNGSLQILLPSPPRSSTHCSVYSLPVTTLFKRHSDAFYIALFCPEHPSPPLSLEVLVAYPLAHCRSCGSLHALTGILQSFPTLNAAVLRALVHRKAGDLFDGQL
ncbi:hypothetical protein EXIGLDRAFT_423669 [Exidia glandulosa HHB12029]|uniref:Uncharacterized protein n=1 Tax=Exidia glandulosa HHB12029 TaxID=1314781 RepID=A0A165BD90_EXIGL|nr:hypothetical protein EXIGLDRAFT_423669 [Exidia glandulosa HHB12029]